MTTSEEGLDTRALLRRTELALAAAGCLSAAAEAELAISRLTAADPGLGRPSITRDELLLIEAYVDARRRGKPPHYILGGAEFMGRWIPLAAATYIPRPWSEAMVRRAIDLLGPATRPLTAVDLGTGSGAFAMCIADAVPGSEVWALDIDAAAVACARVNAADQPTVHVAQGDLFAPLPAELAHRVDLVVASLPYVPAADLAQLPRDYREHEPRVAHDGGDDGLAVDARALSQAREWLRPGGHFLLELGQRQGPRLASVASELGYRATTVVTDEEGDDLFLECVL